MRHLHFAVPFFLTAAGCASAAPKAQLAPPPAGPAGWILCADHPAGHWTNGYPVGNGTMGGLNLGAFPKETIVLNHDAIWQQGPRREVQAGIRKPGIDEAFNLCLKGDFAGAQRAYVGAQNLVRNHGSSFQTLGALEISHEGVLPAHPSAPNRKPFGCDRRLDLLTGESTVKTTLEDGVVSETLIASHPAQCVAVRLETTRPSGLDVRLKLGREAGITARTASGDTLGFAGDAGKGGTRFVARARAVAGQGGQVSVDGDTLVVKGGRSATVFIASATDYNRVEPRAPRADGWALDADRALKGAVETGWDALRRAAAEDHQRLMARCQIDLGATDPAVAKLTTPERLARVKKGGADPDLTESFFQFGRHLLVSSSRPGSLPPNLQGLWEPSLHPMWRGDFHLNINLQMNLWPANATGLAECNEPFFALLKALHKHGQETAASVGCRGYAAPFATDAWAQADIGGVAAQWSADVLGGHWA